MCNGLIGRKIGMTGIFSAEGRLVPVTVIELGPCVVTQIKTEATDGYDALQLGFGEQKEKRINRPMRGHLRKSGANSRFLGEVDTDTPDAFSVGQTIAADLFAIGDRVDVIGTTKGRGFSGVVKRHGFALGRKTHGGKSYRIPGSIGCSAWPSKVVKGKKLPGQYGNARKTVKNLEIVDIRPEENLVLVKGAVPGAASGVVTVRKAKKSST
jgi:large subunit ribosomal protein L3